MKPLLLLPLFLLTSCALSPRTTFEPRSNTTAASPLAFTSEAAPAKPSPDLLQQPTDLFKLGPGDKLDLEILGETGSRAETFVTPDGQLYFDLLPGLPVNGLSTDRLKTELETRLTAFYKHPQVSVNLTQVASQRVWVLGRLNQPGIYPLDRPLRVLDAISLAGGLFTSRFTGTTEELADLQHSFLIRNGQMLPVDFQKLIREGDLSQNIYLRPDDFIYLPSSLTNEVYVLGAVTEPRPVGFMNEMNLLAALGLGLGLRPDADLSRVSIIRGSLTDPKVATVDARDVIQGKATNIKLEPGDIIFVPGSGNSQLSLASLGREAVNTFVRVLAATEGTAAATGQPANVGVNVPLSANTP
jgi:protein involved in polysaccharide export with SLBB domain